MRIAIALTLITIIFAVAAALAALRSRERRQFGRCVTCERPITASEIECENCHDDAQW